MASRLSQGGIRLTNGTDGLRLNITNRMRRTGFSGVHTRTVTRLKFRSVRYSKLYTVGKHVSGRCNSGVVTVHTKGRTASYGKPKELLRFNTLWGITQLLWYDIVPRTGKLYITALNATTGICYLPATSKSRLLHVTLSMDYDYVLSLFSNGLGLRSNYVCVLRAAVTLMRVCYVPSRPDTGATIARAIGSCCIVRNNKRLHSLNLTVLQLPSGKSRLISNDTVCLLGSVIGIAGKSRTVTLAGF